MMPHCIVLDEPTAMLDPVGREEVLSTVRRLNRENGITIVMITHYMKAVSYTHLDVYKRQSSHNPAQIDRQTAVWWDKHRIAVFLCAFCARKTAREGGRAGDAGKGGEQGAPKGVAT